MKNDIKTNEKRPLISDENVFNVQDFDNYCNDDLKKTKSPKFLRKKKFILLTCSCATLYLFTLFICIFVATIVVIVLIVIFYPHISIFPFKLKDVKFRHFSVADRAIALNYTVHVQNDCAYDIYVSDVDLNVYRDDKYIGNGENIENYEKLDRDEVSWFRLMVVIPTVQFSRNEIQEMVREYVETGTIQFHYEGTVKGKAIGIKFHIPFYGDT